MKVCATEGCNIEFNPKTANAKYGDKSCRKTIDVNGLCKYRRENGLFETLPDPETGQVPTTESELRLSYNKLLSEYNKVKTKSDDLAGALYRAVKEDVESVKYVPVPKPKFDRTTKDEEVAVAIIADWQLAKKFTEWQKLYLKVATVTRTPAPGRPGRTARPRRAAAMILVRPGAAVAVHDHGA